nr:RpiB/LacA/LacB family sugar-phosphate isomerase [bacterium]
ARNDDINVLAVAADFTQSEDAQRVLTAFIETPFSKLERHARRIAQLETSSSEGCACGGNCGCSA